MDDMACQIVNPSAAAIGSVSFHGVIEADGIDKCQYIQKRNHSFPLFFSESLVHNPTHGLFGYIVGRGGFFDYLLKDAISGHFELIFVNDVSPV